MTLEQIGDIVDILPGIVVVFDDRGRYTDVFVPPGYADRLPGPTDELRSSSVSETMPGHVSERFLSQINRAIETDSRQTFQYKQVVPAGTRHFETHLIPRPNTDDAVAAIIIDITERKEREQHWYNRLECLFYRLDRNFRVTFLNSATEEFLGVVEHDVLNTPVETILPASVSPQLMSAFREVLDTGECQSLELFYEEFDVYRDEQLFPDDDGVSVVSWDITAEKAEERSRQTELRKYRAVLESVPDVVYRIDAETMEPVSVNEAVRDVFGYTEAEWLADPDCWRKVLHPDDADRVEAFVAELCGTYESGEISYRIETKTGDVRWVRERLRWERDESDDIASLLRIVTDVTDAKRDQHRYSRLVKHLPGIVFRAPVSITERPDYIHGKCEELTGYSSVSLTNEVGHVRSIIDPEDKDDVLRLLDLVDEAGGSYEIDYRITTRGGETKHLREWGESVDSGVIEGIILPEQFSTID